jgi:hypothetical protein
MHKHVSNLIVDFNFMKIIIYLNLHAHKIHNQINFSYFKIMQNLGCYKGPGSRSKELVQLFQKRGALHITLSVASTFQR